MSIASELLQIKGSNELLVLEEAHTWASSHRDSDLAKNLEWDDAKGGHEYRLIQIGRLVRIHVLYDSGARKTVSLSIDRTKPGGGYRDVDDVLRDRNLYAIMLNDALKELERLQIKYQHIKALKPVWTAIKSVRVGKKKGGAKKAA